VIHAAHGQGQHGADENVEGVQDAGRKTRDGRRKEMSSLMEVIANVSAGADSARKRTLWGSSALEMGDHRLLEDGSERGGALVSDLVVSETASEGWGGDSERVGVSMGIDKKANTLGQRRT
jgi:hypothetical protein